MFWPSGRGLSNISNARPPSSRSRSPLRAPPSEPRPQDAPHKQGYRRVTGQHWCAACKDLLPQYFETGWENWVLIAPGGSKHDAGVFLFHVWSLVCCGQDLDIKKVWASTSGIYLPLCKSCMIKFIDILPDQDSCDHKGLADLVDKYRPTQKYASAKAKLTKPQLQAELDYQILRNEQLEKATGAIIAGLFRQQLKMIVKNARDTNQRGGEGRG